MIHINVLSFQLVLTIANVNASSVTTQILQKPIITESKLYVLVKKHTFTVNNEANVHNQ